MEHKSEIYRKWYEAAELFNHKDGSFFGIVVTAYETLMRLYKMDGGGNKVEASAALEMAVNSVARNTLKRLRRKHSFYTFGHAGFYYKIEPALLRSKPVKEVFLRCAALIAESAIADGWITKNRSDYYAGFESQINHRCDIYGVPGLGHGAHKVFPFPEPQWPKLGRLNYILSNFAQGKLEA